LSGNKFSKKTSVFSFAGVLP